MKKIIATFVVVTVLFSCIDGKQIKKVLSQGSGVGMPEYLVDHETFMNELKKEVMSQDISLSFRSSSIDSLEEDQVSFGLTFDKPDFDIKNDSTVAIKSKVIQKVIYNQVVNLNDYYSFQIVFENREKLDNIQKLNSVIVTTVIDGD